MPQVLSSLNSGVRLQSSGNNTTPGELLISGDVNAFFPILQSNGTLASGGALITLNPAPIATGTSAVLLSGQALTLTIEYNANNTQVRFNVLTNASNTPVLTSAFYPLGQEHTVAVAYDALLGNVALSVDGSQDSNYSVNFSLPTTPYASIAIGASTSGNGISNFNGYVDQVVTFNTAPSISMLGAMTLDPLGVNNALKDHTEYVTVNLGKTAVVNSSTPTTAAASNVYVTSNGTKNSIVVNDVTGIQVGDVIQKNATLVGYVTSVDASISATGGKVIYVAPSTTPLLAANDLITFVHQKTTSDMVVASTSPSSSSTTLVVAPTGSFGGDLQVGDVITGLTIPFGTQITAMSTSDARTANDPTTYVNSLTLSAATTAGDIGNTIAASHNVSASSQVANAITNTGSSTITVASVGGIQIGDVVTGNGVPTGAAVVSIDGTSTTLPTLKVSSNITAGATQTLTFTHPTFSSQVFALEGTTATASSTLTLVNTNGIQVGDTVFDITANAALNGAVVAIPSSTTVTLASTATVTSGHLLSFTHVASTLSATGQMASGSKTLTVTNNSGIQVGDVVTANTGITADLVTAVSGNTVTLAVAASANVGSATAPATLTFTHPVSSNTVSTVGYQNSSYNGVTLPVYDTHGIQIGDAVLGLGIPVGDYVTAIDSSRNQVTLNAATPSYVTNGTPITFTHLIADNVQFATISSTTLPATVGGASYKVGDSVVLKVPTSANTSITKTYTVVTSDVSAANALTTESNIAASIVKAFPTIGGYQLELITTSPGATSNTIGFVPQQATPTGLPLIQVSAMNALGVVEDQVNGFYNLTSSNSQLTSVGNPVASISGNTLNGSATTVTVQDTTGGVSGAPKVNAVSYSTAAGGNVQATKVAHGPVYVEFSNYVAGGLATYNIYVDPGFTNSVGMGGKLNSVGLTLQVPTTDLAASSRVSLTPMSGGTLSLVNNDSITSPSLQWASIQGLTDFSQPIASFTLQPSSSSTSINAALTNLSINNKFFQDAVSTSSPMLVSAPLNSQVYTVTGHVFSQYNQSGLNSTTSGTPWTPGAVGLQKPIANVDLSYSVLGNGSSDLRLELEKTVPNLPTPLSAQANFNLDLVATNVSATTTKYTFSVEIILPSNASGVMFTPASGVTATSTVMGHLMSITGTYAAVKGNTSTTPTFGVINATLSNAFNSGAQFSMDMVNMNGTAGTGQSLFVGFAETDSNGAYALNNIPAGTLNLNPYNNTVAAQAQSSGVSVSDALVALNIAAGRGIPSTIQNGVASTAISAANLLPSDYLAADFDGNGVVTASDALQILQYYVSVNKPSVLSYKYLPATANSGLNTPESLTAVVLPTMPSLPTDKDPVTLATLASGNSTKVIDIVGILPGDIVY
jgi:hypothetical protein